MPPGAIDEAEKCPVDHTTRQKLLDAAKANRDDTQGEPTQSTTPIRVNITPQQFHQLLHAQGLTRFSLDRGRWEPIISLPSPAPKPSKPLSADREVSSIPRALPTNHDRHALNAAEKAALPIPANSERDTGHDRDSGNWIYPSQEMFFAAMKRKGHDAQAADMRTIVPIHNAVNERAWSEIKAWEAGRGSEACGGPKLISFAGDSKNLTPRARWKSLMGYRPPFDRHDWVVDRCGKRVDYVIDFYSGKGNESGLGGASGGSLNFYLDVRPKLNTWEGVKTRALRALGM